MSELKCPLCLQEMHKNQDNWFYCGTDYCELKHIEMPKKALEAFAESYQNRLNDCKRIGNLNEELIRTRKALDCAIDTLDTVYRMSEDDGNIETYIKCKRIEINGITKGGYNE